MNIGDRIELKRKEKRINQDELSKKIGKTRSMISKIEKGISAPTLDTIEVLCKELEVSADYLIFGIETPTNSKEEMDLLKLYKKLNDDYSAVAKHEIKKLIKEQEDEQKNKTYEKLEIS